MKERARIQSVFSLNSLERLNTSTEILSRDSSCSGSGSTGESAAEVRLGDSVGMLTSERAGCYDKSVEHAIFLFATALSSAVGTTQLIPMLKRPENEGYRSPPRKINLAIRLNVVMPN
jgi:hypothetical protein